MPIIELDKAPGDMVFHMRAQGGQTFKLGFNVIEASIACEAVPGLSEEGFSQQMTKAIANALRPIIWTDPDGTEVSDVTLCAKYIEAEKLYGEAGNAPGPSQT